MSVLWSLDQSCNILRTWFGRTVIRSACEMEYEQAQQLLDGAKSVEGLGKYNTGCYLFNYLRCIIQVSRRRWLWWLQCSQIKN